MYKEWQDGMKCSYGLENVEKYMYIDVYIYMYRPICVCIYVLKPIYYVLIHTRKYDAQHFESANLGLQFKSMKFFSAPLAKLFYLPSFYPLCFACMCIRWVRTMQFTTMSRLVFILLLLLFQMFLHSDIASVAFPILLPISLCQSLSYVSNIVVLQTVM